MNLSQTDQIERIEKAAASLAELVAKLSGYTQNAAKASATEVGQTARTLIIRADALKEAAQELATKAVIKEQHDYAVEQSLQKTEDFQAVLERRPVRKIYKPKP